MLLPSIIIALLVFIVDQLSKLLFLQAISPGATLHVLPFLDFALARNHGAAFGIFAEGTGWQRWFFIMVAVVISVLILVWSHRLKRKDWWDTVALGMILGGAWGNMLDRMRFGHVVDFIDFYVGNWHWYTFNVADIGICVGAAMLIIATILPAKLRR